MRKLLTVALVAGAVIWASEALSRSALPQASGADSAELRRLRDEDQADRAPKSIDWTVVAPRDRTRLGRVKELYLAGGMHTANDYYNAALVLQHGEAPEDFLLAHEFCVAAMMLGKNDKASSSLAAAAEDRFLMNIGRPQRFGTQFRSEGAGPLRLYSVGEGVTDELRRVMAVPLLAEAKTMESELNKK
jgi:hypothetical protein